MNVINETPPLTPSPRSLCAEISSPTPAGRKEAPCAADIIIIMLALAVVAATAFKLPAHALVPVRPVPTMTHIVSKARVAQPQMLGLAQVAAGANLASFGLYGVALVLKPGWLMKNVMMSDDEETWRFSGIPCAIAQYLGAIYLAQALRMVRALTWMKPMLRTDLLGVGFIQMFLCMVSLARLASGIEKNEVTLTLPLGQGVMAALALIGGSRL